MAIMIDPNAFPTSVCVKQWLPLLLCGALLASCDQAPATSAAPPQAPPVTVAQPFRDKVMEWDEFTGRFEAVDTVEVRARVSGFLEAVHFRDGQKVTQGDLLFVIDKRPFLLALAQAESDVAQAEAQLDLTRNDLERARSLVRRENIPVRELESREAQQRRAVAMLAGARAQVDRAKLDLEWCDVRAAISGRISDSRIDIGNLITGGDVGATLLTTIVSMDPINFVMEGSESDYLKFSRQVAEGVRTSARTENPPVAVRLADEADFFHTGKMDFVDNTLDLRSGTIRARAIFANPSWFLTPGVFGRLRLFGRETDVLLIPDDAISSDQARKIVMTVNGQERVEVKTVELGPVIRGLRVVRKGLGAEDRVIIAGIQRARPGEPVTAQPGAIEPQGK
jgi:RND family efflux transporter MFP subunit